MSLIFPKISSDSVLGRLSIPIDLGISVGAGVGMGVFVGTGVDVLVGTGVGEGV